jgi:hypothetical protein
MFWHIVLSGRRFIMDKKLYDSVEKLLPELSEMIEQALPEEFHKIFSDYNLLTIFHAIQPTTPGGEMWTRRIVNKWKKLGVPRV